MYSFRNDYSDGGHPEVLKALAETSVIQADGYGDDEFCAKASTLLKTQLDSDSSDIHFISGGTLTNLVAISAFLRPHEAVISATCGHIYVHETGSVEATGHKVIPVDSTDGKLAPYQIEAVVSEHHFEHMVKPALVYISQPTEIGTLYSKGELTALREVCDQHKLILYVDGARLGSALTSSKNDLSLTDYPLLCDAFYIGGTKNGALMGEALVLCNKSLQNDFRYNMKQKGALLAKGRALGVQFLRLFEDGLYLSLGAMANQRAAELQEGISALGYDLLFKSFTNQIFPIFPDRVIEALEQKYLFYRWEKLKGGRSVVRLVCSWSTESRFISEFIKHLSEI